VKGRQRVRRKQLLDAFKDTGVCKLEEKAQGRTLWRTRFGRGYGPVARQTIE
jgi:hypothetical protein